MQDKIPKLKPNTLTKKGKRQYANPQATLYSHPTRIKILSNLQSGEKSTAELESLIGENRVNLYHHLNLLEHDMVIKSEILDRKKVFKLLEVNKKLNTPIIFISIPNSEEIQKCVIKSINSIQKLVNSDLLEQRIEFNTNMKGKKILIEFL